MLNSRKSKEIKLLSKNMLQALTFATITCVCSSLQHFRFGVPWIGKIAEVSTFYTALHAHAETKWHST